MKLVELTKKVVEYLKKSGKPSAAVDICRNINLPLDKKRRVYDVLDVLSTLNFIKISRRGNEKLVEWFGAEDKGLRIKAGKDELSLDEKQYCLMNVDLIFPFTDFKTLKNPTWQEMILRDVKRNVKGLLEILVKDVKLYETKKITVQNPLTPK